MYVRIRHSDDRSYCEADGGEGADEEHDVESTRLCSVRSLVEVEEEMSATHADGHAHAHEVDEREDDDAEAHLVNTIVDCAGCFNFIHDYKVPRSLARSGGVVHDDGVNARNAIKSSMTRHHTTSSLA